MQAIIPGKLYGQPGSEVASSEDGLEIPWDLDVWIL